MRVTVGELFNTKGFKPDGFHLSVGRGRGRKKLPVFEGSELLRFETRSEALKAASDLQSRLDAKAAP